MNTFIKALKSETNYGYTENGAIKHNSTLDGVLDMFAFGGAYRERTNGECISLFEKAFEEDASLALKCLFYLRDCRGGQGERRFFKVVMQHIACTNPEAIKNVVKYIPEYGRWDDLYCLFYTPLQEEAIKVIKNQLMLDVQCDTPSLLAKWLKSENTSSRLSRALGNTTREALGMNHKQYRKTLSELRKRINIVEKLMSEKRWDEIKYDMIPSKAGLIYRNAFAKHDYDRYAEFMYRDKDVSVNADVLNPVDIVHQVFATRSTDILNRQVLQNYWDNLKDYYNGREESGIAVVDVSGSMYGKPLEAAIAMGAYIAERGKGPFKNHFITFDDEPELIDFYGSDIYEKVIYARDANWGGSTNIEATMDLILQSAINNHLSPAEMPTRLYIFSDMEFNRAFGYYDWTCDWNPNTLFESIEGKWHEAGYEIPQIIFWNLNARNDNIPAIGERFSYVSGFSMSMVDTILGNKSGIDLMLEKLNSKRYAQIHI